MDVTSTYWSAIAADVAAHGAVFEDEGSTTTANAAAKAALTAQDELAGDAAQIAAALKLIPNDLGYEEWIKLSMAVKAAGGEDVKDAWVEWSLSWPQNNLAGCEEKWRSFQGPFSVGAAYVFERARPFGFNDAALVFSKIAGGSSQLGLEGGAELPGAGGEVLEGPTGPTQRETMFRDYVFVESVEMFGNVATGETINQRIFNSRHPRVGPVKSSTKCASSVYLDTFSRRTILKNLTYRPGLDTVCDEESERVFNTWRGPQGVVLPESASDEDAAPFLKHLHMLFGKSHYVDIFLDWSAQLLQFPGDKINWSLFIKSEEQGIGKDLLAAPLIYALGKHNVSYVEPPDLTASFNDWCANKVLVVVPEMQNFNRVELMNALKRYQAAPPDVIRINAKFKAAYDIPNIFKMLGFTNRADAMFFELTDRRNCVIESDSTRQPVRYYVEYGRWLRKGGLGVIVRWLLNRDMSQFNRFAPAPNTEAKDRMRRASLPALEAWLHDAYEDEQAPFDRDIVTLADVSAVVPQGLRNRGVLSNERLAHALKRELGAVYVGRAHMGGQGAEQVRGRLFVLRNHDAYKGWDPSQVRNEYLKSRGTKPVIAGQIINLFEPKA